MLKVFILFLFLLFSCGKKTVYDLSFYDLNGREVKIKNGEKPLLLYVWTGTCIGHQEDMKRLNEYYEKLVKRYKVVSLAVFMKTEDVGEFLKESNIKPKFLILTDPTGNLTSIVKLVFLPATLVFEPSGELKGNYPRLPLSKLLKDL